MAANPSLIRSLFHCQTETVAMSMTTQYATLSFLTLNIKSIKSPFPLQLAFLFHELESSWLVIWKQTVVSSIVWFWLTHILFGVYAVLSLDEIVFDQESTFRWVYFRFVFMIELFLFPRSDVYVYVCVCVVLVFVVCCCRLIIFVFLLSDP